MTLVNSSRESRTAQFSAESIIRDYRVAVQSREASLIGRKEVLTGKAKFGIFGDGKEVPQLAMARAFRPGDVRSGYYRDQTLMFALGMSSIREFFAQLYADTDVEHDPASGGRQMNCHFATRALGPDGGWKNLSAMYNSTPDMSPTGSQMPRLVGLAHASRLFREVEVLRDMDQFSNNGNEIAFGTIGNASCAEGVFWEAVNAIGVLNAPALLSIWDDGFGISVPNEFQVTKGDLSELLRGFQREEGTMKGYDIYTVRGWDFAALCETYLSAAAIVREQHVPAIIHVTEVTQPQGHSTSGSHERYKSPERLEWEREYDCIRRMRQWMIEQGVATAEELARYEKEDRTEVREIQRGSWSAYRAPIEEERRTFVDLAKAVEQVSRAAEEVGTIRQGIERHSSPFRRDLMRATTSILAATRGEDGEAVEKLREWRDAYRKRIGDLYGAELHSSSRNGALNFDGIPARYDEDAPTVNGFEILNACFDAALAEYPEVLFMGEDVGKLGDVNQGCAGLQEKYGDLRVSDTGIRETTIIGQAIGLSMRGLRPVAEMQYLDYVLYGLQIMSDDLATVRWRSCGGYKAPVIVRTRGHRLEGIWHSGSQMAGILNLVRGMYVCVPRNMTQAAGMYNTLFLGDDPAIVVEVLNGYRVKERLPSNVREFRVPLGVPEVLRSGSDVTIVTYGACCRVVLEAVELLGTVGIDAAVIDVQTLLPFDRTGVIVESLRRTSRILFVDEDVPGGATAFMLQKVLEEQRGYEWLDSEPRTLAAREHRAAYGSDGDYWSKPGREDVFYTVYDLMREAKPQKYTRI